MSSQELSSTGKANQTQERKGTLSQQLDLELNTLLTLSLELPSDELPSRSYQLLSLEQVL